MASAKNRIPIWVALVLSGLAGVLVATQSRINGGLSGELGNGYVTAAVSFGLGFIVIAIAFLCSPRARKGLTLLKSEVRRGRLPYWALTGGVFGSIFVLSQGLVATMLGLALFAVGIVAGQVLGGLIFDRFGLGPGGVVPLTTFRVLGTVLAIAAVAFSVFADIFSEAGHGSTVWLIVVPLLVGVGVSFQSTVNGLVRSAAQSAMTATFLNFLVGTSILVVAAAISVAINGWPETWPTEFWHYIGGPIGVVFIAMAALLVRTAGVLLLSMSNVAGQLVASVVFEAAFPLAGGVTLPALLAATVALLAVAVAAQPGRAKS